jgi:hypothetical protein
VACLGKQTINLGQWYKEGMGRPKSMLFMKIRGRNYLSYYYYMHFHETGVDFGYKDMEHEGKMV